MSNEDFEAEDFEPDEVVFPYAPPQQWVVLNSEVPEAELAVYTFLMTHLNPHNGKFDTVPGRRRIADRFGRSLDWVDKRMKKLIELGALTKRSTYWLDPFDHSQGRSESPIDKNGTKRAQAPNRYRVKLKPAEGAAYAGPIKIDEYYRPDRMQKRVEENRRTEPETTGDAPAADERPPYDQQESGFSLVTPQPPYSGRGPAADERLGGPRHSGPKDHGAEDHGDAKDHGGPEPFGDTQKVPDLQKVYEGNAGHFAWWVPKQSDQSSNPLTARARTTAGPAACQAFEANPSISQADLAEVIRQEQPNLSHGQATGRAAQLLATHKREGDSAPPAAS